MPSIHFHKLHTVNILLKFENLANEIHSTFFYFLLFKQKDFELKNFQPTILTLSTGRVANSLLFTIEPVNRESQREGNNALLKGMRKSPCSYWFITSKTVTPPSLAFDRLTCL